jgi:hypothetical protein
LVPFVPPFEQWIFFNLSLPETTLRFWDLLEMISWKHLLETALQIHSYYLYFS